MNLLNRLTITLLASLFLLPFTATLADTTQADAPCIAIAAPKAQLGQGASGQDVATPVQNMFISYLSGPMLKVIPLESKLPAQMQAEAKMANCEYIMHANINYKKKRRFGKALSIGAGVLSSALPYAGIGGGMGSYVAATAAANAANSAASAQMQEEAMQTLTAAQGSILKGDSILLDYQLVKLDAKKPFSKNEFDLTAEQDGQDLILPLIEQAAGEIFQAVTQ